MPNKVTPLCETRPSNLVRIMEQSREGTSLVSINMIKSDLDIITNMTLENEMFLILDLL